MKNIVIIGAFGFLISCGTFKNSLNEAVQTMTMAIIPDTCETYFIIDLSEYLSKNSHLPDSTAIKRIHSNLSSPCQQTIQDIRSVTFGMDSMDFAFTKTFMDTTQQLRSMTKGYRLLFERDSLKEIRILHLNSKYQTELFSISKE